MDVHGHSSRVNVTDLEIESFFQSQSQRVERPKQCGVVVAIRGSDQSMDFADRHHGRQSFLLWDFDLFQYVPIARASRTVEELQCTVSHFQRAGSELAIVDQMQQIVSHLLLAQLVRREVEVTRKFTNFPQVAIMRTLGSTKQLQVLTHFLPKVQRVFGVTLVGILLLIVVSFK